MVLRRERIFGCGIYWWVGESDGILFIREKLFLNRMRGGFDILMVY